MKTRTLSKQSLGKSFLGIGVTLALVAGGIFAATPAISDDEDPSAATVSSASASFLNAKLGGTNLTEALRIASLSAIGTIAGGESASEPLLLANLLDELSSSVGQLLPGVTTSFLNVSDVRQTVQAQSDGTAYASSAAVSGQAPTQQGLSGRPTSAQVDLAGLLGDSLSAQIADLVLELEALSSSAQGTGLTQPTGTYNVAGARVVLKTGLLEDLAGTLTNDVVGPIDQTVSALIGTNGALSKVINGLSDGVNTLLAILGTSITPTLALDLNLTSVLNSTLARDFGSQGVTINLSKGLLVLDLDQLLGGPGSLNNLAPNTSLLTTDLVATITKGLTSAVSDLVSSLLTGVTDSLHHTKLKVGLDVRVLGFSTILPPVAQLTLNINMSLGELISGKPLPGQPAGTAYVALAFGGIPAKLDIAKTTSALVVPINKMLFDPKTGALGTLSQTVLPTTIDSLKGVLNPVLDVLRSLVDIKVNVQKYTTPERDPKDPFTQTALELSVLGLNGGSGGIGGTAGTNSPTFAPLVELGLASSTVQASVVNPTVSALPVARGNNITVQGGSFDGATEAELSLYVLRNGNEELLSGPVTTSIISDVDAGIVDGFVNTSFVAPQNLPPGTQLFFEATSTLGDFRSPVFIPTTTPTVSSQPQVVQGASINVDIQDFTQGSNSTLELVDVNNDRTRLAENISGARTITLSDITVPATVPAGAARLIASSADGDYAERQITVIAAPRITINPSQIAQGETFQVSGTGFSPNTDVTLTHTPLDSTTPRIITVSTDSNGVFSTDPIATQTDEPVGEGTLTAQDTNNRSAAGTLLIVETPDTTPIPNPILTATPTQVLHGETIEINGTDFVPNTEVVLTYRDSNNDVIGQSNPIETEDGNISTTFTIPQNAAIGAIEIRAHSNIDQQATTTVNLTVRAAPNPPSLVPAVTVTPKTFPVGKTAVQIAATGFPNGTADVTISGPSGFLAELRGATILNNALNTGYQPSTDWPAGSYRVRVQSNVDQASASDTFSVTVVPEEPKGTDPDWNTTPPTPSPSGSPSVSPTPTPTVTPTPTGSPSVTPTPTAPEPTPTSSSPVPVETSPPTSGQEPQETTAPTTQPPTDDPTPTNSPTQSSSPTPLNTPNSRMLGLNFSADSVSHGDTQEAVADGFNEGEIVSIYLGTDKLLLPNTTATADGKARWTFTVVDELETGKYTATATSVSKSDSVQAQFEISAIDSVLSPVSGSGTESKTNGYVYTPQVLPGVPALARTGLESSAAWLGILAALFIVAGAALQRKKKAS